MEHDPLKSQFRREQREGRLGYGACCVLCGASDLRTLRFTKGKLFEKHHVVGIAHDRSLRVIICLNCHAKLTADLLDAGADMRKQATLLHRLAMILRALGSFFLALGKAFCQYANDILELATSLDENFKDWRHLPEAK